MKQKDSITKYTIAAFFFCIVLMTVSESFAQDTQPKSFQMSEWKPKSSSSAIAANQITPKKVLTASALDSSLPKSISDKKVEESPKALEKKQWLGHARRLMC